MLFDVTLIKLFDTDTCIGFKREDILLDSLKCFVIKENGIFQLQHRF